MRQNIGLFFFFGLVGTLFDRMWVTVGAMRYLKTTDPQPWWVVLQYAVMGVVAVHAAAWITRLLVRRDAPPPRDLTARFAISASWFVLAELAGGLFNATDAALVGAVLAGVWLIRIILHPHGKGQRRAILAVTLALGIAGTIGEAVLVRMGIMEYANPGIPWLNLPWWVPGLWLQAGFLARDIGRAWFGGR